MDFPILSIFFISFKTITIYYSKNIVNTNILSIFDEFLLEEEDNLMFE